MPLFKHVAVVGGKDDRTARAAGFVEDRAQVVTSRRTSAAGPCLPLSRVSSIVLSTTATALSLTQDRVPDLFGYRPPGPGARSALWKTTDLRLPQNAAKPARSWSWPPAAEFPVSRLVRETG